VLAEADGALSDYLARPPIPFYPWLRQLAWDRLVALHRRHVAAQRRSVTREENGTPPDDDASSALVDRLIDSHSSPSRQVLREELRGRVRAALDRLAARDREVLVLRHLEQLSTTETAVVLGVTEER